MRSWAGAVLGILGCSPLPPAGGEGSEVGSSGSTATATSGATTTSEAPTSGTSTGGTSTGMSSTSGASTGSGEDDSGATFIAEDDRPPEADECDVWQQDCPIGQKCAPYVFGNGSTWNALRCVPVVADARAPGEPCTMPGGIHDGADDCAFGAYCWDLDAEDRGTCTPLCTGTARDPACPANHSCAIHNEVLTLCLGWCHPLGGDCRERCIPYMDGWFCVLEGVESVHALEPCEYESACDSGLVCMPPASAVECDPSWSGCCQPLCDVNAANTCPGAGQTCRPWYEPGQAPEGYEDLGVCRV